MRLSLDSSSNCAVTSVHCFSLKIAAHHYTLLANQLLPPWPCFSRSSPQDTSHSESPIACTINPVLSIFSLALQISLPGRPAPLPIISHYYPKIFLPIDPFPMILSSMFPCWCFTSPIHCFIHICWQIHEEICSLHFPILTSLQDGMIPHCFYCTPKQKIFSKF